MIDLRQGDCLEILKDIPDKSVNLVLTDPPYNIKKDKWDKFTGNEYIEFMAKIFGECERVLKDNGTLYFFHNDMVQIAQLMEHLRNNTNLHFNSFIILEKKDWRALSWKNPSEKNNLRCWFNICEYVLCYVKGECLQTEWDTTGWQKVINSPDCFLSLKQYFYDEKIKSRLTNKQINEVLGTATTGSGMAGHYFKLNLSQWTLPTEEQYKKLQSTGYFRREYEDLRREYEDLRREYEDLRREYEDLRFKHHLDKEHCNVFEFKRDKGKNYHSCQKPLNILERLIKCSSDEGDVVLDMFMGSGSTGVACINTNRNFIGIEKDPKYFEIAKERINAPSSLKN